MKNDMMIPMQNMSKKMDSMHMTGNPDHDFAEMMKRISSKEKQIEFTND
jgi:hypothetical protein